MDSIYLYPATSQIASQREAKVGIVLYSLKFTAYSESKQAILLVMEIFYNVLVALLLM